MIAHVDNRITYNGNGNATEFAYQFKILDRTDIKVLLVKPDGSTQILSKDYYVDVEKSVVIYPGYAPGAEIPESERPPVLPAGWRLVLYREVPITQLVRLPEFWPFNVIEAMADKLTFICQQLKDKLSRALTINESSASNIDTTVPWVPGKTFRVSDDGTHLQATEDPGKVIDEAKGLAEETATNAQEAKQAAAEIKTIYNSGGLTPITDLAGSIGTVLKRWGYIFANKVFAMNLPIVYKSVAEMKADNLLSAGMTACTLGYYAINDGGGATYIIHAKQESDIDDGGSLHELTSGLVAELVVENGMVCPEQFGAKGDGVTDDTDAFVNVCQHKNVLLKSPAYRVKYLKLYKNTTIRGNNTTLYVNGGYDEFSNTNTYGLIINAQNNVTVTGIKFIFVSRCVYAGYISGNGINVNNCAFLAENVTTENDINAWNIGDIVVKAVENFRFIANDIDGSRGKGIELTHATRFLIKNNTIKNTGRGAIYLDPCFNGIVEGNILLRNKLNFSVSDGAIDFYGANTSKDVIVRNNIVNNYAENSSYTGCGVRIKSCEDITIENNTFYVDNPQSFGIILVQNRTAVADTGHKIINNKLICKNNCYTQYFIRIVQSEGVICTNIQIIGNELVYEGTPLKPASEMISIRSPLKNSVISKNHIVCSENEESLFFYDAPSVHDNVDINGNIFEISLYVKIRYLKNSSFINNVVFCKGDRALAVYKESENCLVANNIFHYSRNNDIEQGVTIDSGSTNVVVVNNVAVNNYNK